MNNTALVIVYGVIITLYGLAALTVVHFLHTVAVV